MLFRSYKFDAAGRLNGLHQNAGGEPNGSTTWPDTDLVYNTSFTSAGQLATLNLGTVTETRSYNNLLQLTNITSGVMNLSYVYPAGANNGRISAEINNLTNTQVAYTYDELSRLKTAVSTTGATTNWGLQFGFDVYGNRTAQTVTAGTAPQSNFVFGNNNRMIVPSTSYDANGNQLSTPDSRWPSYDPDNRTVSVLNGMT